jgi:uncharacterized protein YbbC (DUF1343 family)
MNGDNVAAALNVLRLPGLRFVAQPFIPIAGLYSGQRCGGVAVRITDRAAIRSMRMGLEIAAILQKLYPAQFDPDKTLLLVGDPSTVSQLRQGVSPDQIVASWSPDLAAFEQLRKNYFLYK